MTDAIDRLNDPFIRDRLHEAMHSYARGVLQKHGRGAFLSTEDDAAFHELGHACYEAAVNQPVTLVRIDRTETGWWGGLTESRNGYGFGRETSADVLLDIARYVKAGREAECFFQLAEFREGSSLDELILSAYLIDEAARRTGSNAAELLVEQDELLHRFFARHEQSIREAVAVLKRRKCLMAGRLERLLAPMRGTWGEA